MLFTSGLSTLTHSSQKAGGGRGTTAPFADSKRRSTAASGSFRARTTSAHRPRQSCPRRVKWAASAARRRCCAREDSGLRPASGVEVWGLGTGDWGLGIGDWGLVCGVWGLKCGVWGFEFRI